MAIDRRKFLQILGGSTASLYALDLDKLLWVPGGKKIFLPPEQRLIYASEVAMSQWEHTVNIIRELYNKDNLLYKMIVDNPIYNHETGKWKTVQIYHGYKE